MARATHIPRPSSTPRPSTSLLGRVKLQAISTDPTPPRSVQRPTPVRRPTRPHRASIRDYL